MAMAWECAVLISEEAGCWRSFRYQSPVQLRGHCRNNPGTSAFQADAFHFHCTREIRCRPRIETSEEIRRRETVCAPGYFLLQRAAYSVKKRDRGNNVRQANTREQHQVLEFFCSKLHKRRRPIRWPFFPSRALRQELLQHSFHPNRPKNFSSINTQFSPGVAAGNSTSASRAPGSREIHLRMQDLLGVRGRPRKYRGERRPSARFQHAHRKRQGR